MCRYFMQCSIGFIALIEYVKCMNCMHVFLQVWSHPPSTIRSGKRLICSNQVAWIQCRMVRDFILAASTSVTIAGFGFAWRVFPFFSDTLRGFVVKKQYLLNKNYVQYIDMFCNMGFKTALKAEKVIILDSSSIAFIFLIKSCWSYYFYNINFFQPF